MGITADDLTQVTQSQAQWQTALDNYMALQASLSQSRQEAKDARDRLEGSLVALQHNPKITDVHRLGLGITVPDPSRTSVVAIPTTAPVVQVDLSKRFEHIINLADKETPNRRRKPKGVTGCEIWVKIGDNIPKEANELRLVNVARTTPFNAKYSGNEVGKMAHYMLRWVTSRGELGPWSQTYSFTIPG
ncbi:MAG: hypothetical protein GDA48_22510 [Hormoscilla sp. GM102CHS1]|nr:hypothetical protein [Hormoscilla sp. GM102CHS1]